MTEDDFDPNLFVQPAVMVTQADKWERERLAPYAAAISRLEGIPGTIEGLAAEADWLPEAKRPVVLKAYREDTQTWAELARDLLPRPFAIPFVTLVGKTGAGKTTGAYALVLTHTLLMRNTRLEKARSALAEAAKGRAVERVKHRPFVPVFVHAKALADARRFSPLGSDPELLRKASHADLLVIDDVIGQKDQDSDLYNVIWHRDNEALPTILTTAMPYAEMTEAYGEMFARRVFGGTAKIITRKP